MAGIDAAKNELTTFRGQKQKELNAIQTSALVDLNSYYSLAKAAAAAGQQAGQGQAPADLQASAMSESSGSGMVLTTQVQAINTDLQDSILFNRNMLEQLQHRIQRRAHEIDLSLGTIKQLVDAERKQKNNLKFR